MIYNLFRNRIDTEHSIFFIFLYLHVVHCDICILLNPIILMPLIFIAIFDLSIKLLIDMLRPLIVATKVLINNEMSLNFV